MEWLRKSCSFTGHRPHKFPWRYNEADSRCAALKAVMAEQIEALVEAGVTQYYSGGADGTDLWCAEIVLALRKKNPALNLHYILPCEGQADKWSDSAQKRYRYILKRANSVDYVSRNYYDGCMLDRNHRLIESAGVLLAVYNGARHSGTGATVAYARKMGREVIVIDPITRTITCEGTVPFSAQSR